ncbi:MAG: response regulator [Candidatus Pacebacteria bacterium]|jgi:response regulator of citrate/malate metabolism|nr:response regulator [Candidatus Paceibacterota bacterium]
MENNLNILIVDDLELVHEPIEKFLKDFVFINQNCIVTSAYNLTQAKRLLLDKKFDLVMLDGDAGDGWGYEIIADILNHNSTVKIVSSSNDDDFNSKNVEMGSHASVNKIWLYPWLDEKNEYKIEKGKLIRDLFAME